ncbi:Uncharacterized NAD(P)/FAD-binding protein YdhS [Amycolatopsis marina]|uniref:Uncharacterized NAD(P)/FAD-binding protein YdhS n=1 Tax=Amycolatopsis marina TaxID=490629 RepID=A0A1I1BVU7_9PSEU|nr:FAD/NAD(P)-binding protein [Amycolatopsis marina]SFB54555.1 Uncharacterized NAD(P)/FAD-binding protein YdhS [Amycolatopsis marina]
MEIGIIGAGAAGVSLLDALSLTEPPPSGVTVFEGSSCLWRGRAYQPDVDAVRVNAPPALMSIRHDDQLHYTRWLAEHDGHLDTLLGVPIVPRAVYGEYLEATAMAAISRLRHRGCHVSVINDWVTGYSPLLTRTGGTHTLDHAVLCVGGGRPLDHYGLEGSPGFVLEPYPLARTLYGVPDGSHVVVIGSGLTAVDIVAALAANGHSGPITLLSRQGVLPYVQQTPVKLEFRHLTRENLPDTFAGLVAAMRAELGEDLAPLAAEITGAEDAVERLRRQLSEVDSPHPGRRMLSAAVHMFGPVVWPRLPAGERTVLRTQHFRTITSLASPMVPGNAEILLRLFDSGQLRLMSGVPKIEPAMRGFRVRGARELSADVVLNAVNPPAHAIPARTEPLVSSLLDAGVITLPATGGVSLRSGGVHTLGGITASTSFITPSVPTLAAGASAVAAEITSGR